MAHDGPHRSGPEQPGPEQSKPNQQDGPQESRPDQQDGPQRQAAEPTAAARQPQPTASTGTPPEQPAAPAPGSAGGDAGRFGIPGRPLRRNSFLVGFTGALGVLSAYVVYLGLRNAAGILVLVVIALFLAVGLHPAVVRLCAAGLPRGLAVAAVTLTVLALLAAGVLALVPPIVIQSGQFLDQLPSYLDTLRRNEAVNDLVVRFDLMRRAQEAANADVVGRALGGVLGGAQLVFGTVFRVLTVLVLTIYFLVYFDRMRDLGYALVPRSRRERVQLIGDEILTKVGAYMVGALSIAVLAGVTTFVFALIVGLPYPFALAVVVAVTDLIPQIGATLGAVIVSLVGFATDPSVGIACVVFFVVYQQIENYLIYPKIMRRSVHVNEVAALVAALLGVSLLGVIGALIAIPTVAATQLILREVVLPRQDAR
ncbi:AI-2E family transporter [Verrucosispora sp. ts21]|uniref:AI-2E family transporter n=1 Tax=Verrucosispora sp. ts21 TaxID=2069341 RepID=UPI000C87DF39|nr:AI-2E family transporter [Verrucosispora sp. ts21]PMR58320.1 AI-2E family transporter [Verrucosispora sp. ts21]